MRYQIRKAMSAVNGWLVMDCNEERSICICHMKKDAEMICDNLNQACLE